MAEEKEALTIPEAIGFWQKNKGWIIPALAAIGGVLGGNVDKVAPLLPNTGDVPSIIKRLDADEARIGIVEAKIGVSPSVPTDTTKKNDGSQDSGVIHIN